MIDRRPAAIARCASVDDVAACRRRAARRGASRSRFAPAVIRSPGCSLCDDGLVIDVAALNEITVDPVARTARAGAGATWAQFDAATQEHGLATTGGRVSTTGVAGLTLGGGSGWLERSLRARLRQPDRRRARDRGRASSCARAPTSTRSSSGRCAAAAATSASSRRSSSGSTRSARRSSAGSPPTTRAHGRAVGGAFRDFHEDGGPDAGRPRVRLHRRAAGGVHPGGVAREAASRSPPACGTARSRRASALSQPLRDVAEPIVDLYGEIPYAELQSHDRRPARQAELVDGRVPRRASGRGARRVRRLRRADAAQLHAVRSLLPWGGEVARRTDTPLAKRDATWVIHPFCVWDGAERDEEHIAWGRACRDVFAQWRSGGVYLNFVGDEGEERVRAAFGEAYERLAAVKAQYDPDNLFRGNQNIRPSGARP